MPLHLARAARNAGSLRGVRQFAAGPKRDCRKINKLLVANRGEISARISRACHELDIDTLAIYAKEDANG